jgi:TonB family protein
MRAVGPALIALGLSFSVAAAGQFASSSQSQSTSSTGHQPGLKYTLEAVTIQNAAYPKKARKKKLEGRVFATFRVSETGDVAGVWASAVDPDLLHATEAAVKEAVAKWKFKPVVQDGSAMPVVGKATFMFDLRDASQRANGVPADILGGMDPPTGIRVSNGVIQKLLLKKVDPVYPEEAKRNHIRGTVLLAVNIDRDGAVANVIPVSGPPELVDAAVEAVKQWRYKPYLLLDTPVVVNTQIPIDFH